VLAHQDSGSACSPLLPAVLRSKPVLSLLGLLLLLLLLLMCIAASRLAAWELAPLPLPPPPLPFERLPFDLPPLLPPRTFPLLAPLLLFFFEFRPSSTVAGSA
jgi:hypothetical protein